MSRDSFLVHVDLRPLRYGGSQLTCRRRRRLSATVVVAEADLFRRSLGFDAPYFAPKPGSFDHNWSHDHVGSPESRLTSRV